MRRLKDRGFCSSLRAPTKSDHVGFPNNLAVSLCDVVASDHSKYPVISASWKFAPGIAALGPWFASSQCVHSNN